MTQEVLWLGVGAIGACAAAGVAAAQIWFSRVEAKRQAAFEHIHGVEERLHPVWHLSIQGAQADALAFYRHERDELTAAAADYLAYLTSLDLLVFACETKSIDRTIATTWLRGRLQRDDELLQFIVDLQAACGDPSCYEYLKRHLAQAWHRAITVQPKRGEGK